MTYQTEIAKTQLPVFAELYDFIFPDFEFYLTPYPTEITYNNKTYIPCVMERDELKAEKGEERTLTISFATKEDTSLEFLNFNIPKIKVIVRRYFIELMVAKILFVGEGEVVGVNERILTFKVTDILSLNKRIVPPLIYSSYCNNTLFDNRCLVNKSNHTYVTQVTTSANGSVLMADIFGTVPDNYFTYGYVAYRNNYRWITKHDRANGRIHLHIPFDKDVNGKTVKVYAGCDKTPRCCRDRFNNLANFLGFPYIPSKNPVIWGL